MEEYTLLCDHYEFYDSLKPNEKLPEEELFLLEFLASVKAIPEAASELGIHVSGAERQKLCMEKLHKLVLCLPDFFQFFVSRIINSDFKIKNCFSVLHWLGQTTKSIGLDHP
jgi:hypothetical protein